MCVHAWRRWVRLPAPSAAGLCCLSGSVAWTLAVVGCGGSAVGAARQRDSLTRSHAGGVPAKHLGARPVVGNQDLEQQRMGEGVQG